MKLNFDKHRAEPHITLEQYERQLRIELGKSLEGKNRIYLDKRFWIIARDVVLGRRTDVVSTELLTLLRGAVQDGAAVCPISGVLFVELLKQSDLHTRRETAKLIDELSLGVSLATNEERIATELAHFFYSTLSPDLCLPLDYLVWVKVSYTLGMLYPSGTPFDAETELAIQKSFLDEMWGVTLVDMVDTIGGAQSPSSVDFAALAQRLTTESREHDHENRSFKQLYESELIGALDLYTEQACIVLERIFESGTGQRPIRSEVERLQTGKEILAFFVNTFREGRLLRQLPGVHIHAMCHASVRWDKQRHFKGNDLFDFHHAEAALGYCDLFLTDGPMKVILTANHVGLDKKMECAVLADISEAVDYLKAAQYGISN